MLDLESFTYLSRALESTIAPIVILASNRGLTTIRGTSSTPSSLSDTDGLISAHGIPPDLLARLLIVPTHPYSPDEIRTIIGLRAKTEGISLAPDALQEISKQGTDVSLRYALQLLAPAKILANVAGRQDIGVAEVKECEDLFLDARRSALALGGGGKFIV